MHTPPATLNHPAVLHLDQLVEAVRMLGVPAHLTTVVTNTLMHTYVSVADDSGTLLPLEQVSTSGHQKLLMAKHLPTVLDRARDWYHATQRVPGLADLCGTGILTVAFPNGDARIGWEPRVRADDRVHAAEPPEPRLPLTAVLRDLAQAVGCAPETVFGITPIFLFFAKHQASAAFPSYGLVHSTPAMVRALEQVLANPGRNDVAPYLVLTEPGRQVGGTPTFQKARLTLPKVPSRVVDGITQALADLTDHLETPAPTALHRIEFQTHPHPEMVVVHDNDAEDRDEDAPLLPPFTETEHRWLEEAGRRWSSLISALPSDGFWTGFGLTAVATPVLQGLSLSIMGKGLRGHSSDLVPRCWLVATRGRAAIVRTHPHSPGYPSRGTNPNTAAALVLEALQLHTSAEQRVSVYTVMDT